MGCENAERLMTIPGVDVTIAMSITAAVGDFSRFSSPGKLVSYLGLNPNKCLKPTVFVITDLIEMYPKQTYEKGMAIITASVNMPCPARLGCYAI